MAWFLRGGARIAFDDIQPAAGAAGTVLLVHGFATSRAENWRRLGWYGAFERKGWRTVALDLRGHGESDKPHDPSAYAGAELLADIVGLMDHLELSRADLMGYSMGAHLSLQMALLHGARVGNLIVGGVGGRMFEPPRSAEGGAMTMAQAMAAEDPQTIQDATMRGFRLFAEQQGEDRQALAAFTQDRAVAPAIRRDAFGAITAPTLVVAGARDEMAGDPQALADAIPGARSATLPACDHFSAIPHALFKAAVFDFLEGWLE
ncbi:MAG TPA: alpha/beta fold hydrolase [Caulobacteraceae bacterium]|nr:alpha/beta fold hydrolase [Caulobacteraceae bacterium]